jgi:hypothetical protein
VKLVVFGIIASGAFGAFIAPAQAQTTSTSGGYVRSYTRRDGTIVPGHYRNKRDTSSTTSSLKFGDSSTSTSYSTAYSTTYRTSPRSSSTTSKTTYRTTTTYTTRSSSRRR